MICILHGYLLEGSGSNLWTRSVVEALCRDGETVHLVCQEPHPDRYDCIAEAYRYHPDGRVETMVSREVPYPGRCIMHKPQLGDTIPVYVWDRYEEYPNAIPMINLDDRTIEDYVAWNTSVVRGVVERHPIHALHANHAVLMSVVAQRVSAATGVPYAIMPHGSALEYVLKRDERFLRMASDAFAGASRIFVHGDEMRSRVRSILRDIPDFARKASVLPLGVHTWQFEPVPRERRREKIGRLLVSLAGKPRGRRPSQLRTMLEALPRQDSLESLRTLFRSLKYDAKLPDEDVEEKIAALDWEHDAVLLYVGRLISAKGVQSGVAALPLLLADDPGVRLLIVGHGPLREPLEALLWALERGDRALVERIVDYGQMLEGNPDGEGGHMELGQVGAFFRELEARGELERYFALAREHVRADRVVFMGYLTHAELQHLFPCCDAGIFPSVVKEAGPLVFLEALASGCFPLGTYFAGMRASIDAIADTLPPHILDAMKLDVDDTVADIVANVHNALRFGTRYKDVLSRTAQERYDWTSVARKLLAELTATAVPGTEYVVQRPTSGPR